MAAFLVDTNVLVYAVDRSDAAKSARSLECLRRLRSSGGGAFTTQVLGEFFVAARRKIVPSPSEEDLETLITNLARSWLVFDVTTLGVLEAVRGVRRHQLSYWDGLIWATAKLNGVPTILTEDLPGSAMIEGVRFEDPFDPTFDLTRLDGQRRASK